MVLQKVLNDLWWWLLFLALVTLRKLAPLLAFLLLFGANILSLFSAWLLDLDPTGRSSPVPVASYLDSMPQSWFTHYCFCSAAKFSTHDLSSSFWLQPEVNLTLPFRSVFLSCSSPFQASEGPPVLCLESAALTHQDPKEDPKKSLKPKPTHVTFTILLVYPSACPAHLPSIFRRLKKEKHLRPNSGSGLSPNSTEKDWEDWVWLEYKDVEPVKGHQGLLSAFFW